jgi:hypothetical protein
MRKKFEHKQSGSTLAVVISTLAILMAIVASAVYYTTTINRNTQRTVTLQTALAVGDSAIEILFNNWRTTCRSTAGSPANVTRALPTSFFTAIPTPTPFPGLSTTNFVKRGSGLNPASDSEYDPTYTISNYKVIAVDAEYQGLADVNTAPEPQLGQLAAGVAPTPGVNTSATYNYVASADVTLNASFGSTTQRNVVAKIRRVFQKQQLWPWNWAIFYVDPLEIHPGPLFTVTGWVHTNADLYTGHWSLTFADKVTYAGDWFESTPQNLGAGFMPGDGYHSSTDPANGSPNYASGLPPARDQAMQPFGLDSTSIWNTNDANPNNDSYAELIQPPVAGSSDPLAGQRYWDQASVIVRINADNTYTIGYPDSTNNYAFKPVGPGTLSPLDWRYTMFNGAITPGTTTSNGIIQDNREGAQIRLATLDLSQIETADGTAGGNGVRYDDTNATHSTHDFNGVVYIYDASATSGARRGIRIKNGSKIPNDVSPGAGGLTIASNNPVYIQGDFNTGGTGSTVPSNNPTNQNSDGTYIDPSNPPSSTAPGYNRAPCLILADAVNLLSSGWNDVSSGTVPIAADTTYNTAIIAGIVPTNVNSDGAYSGGAENFPRFLENWDKKTLTYYGSMVELYKSQQSLGEWGKANVYSPPTREWYFDTNFKTNPPPGTLTLYSYVKGRWFVL